MFVPKAYYKISSASQKRDLLMQIVFLNMNVLAVRKI